MPHRRPPLPLIRTLLAAVAALLGALAVSAPTASAAAPPDSFACRGIALDISTGPLPLDPILNPIEGLISAGSDDAKCASDDGSPIGGTLDNTVRPALRLLGIDLGAITTTTTTDSTKPSRLQEPEAYAKVAGLDVGIANLASILEVDAVESRVQATCVAGTPRFTGSSQIGDVRAFGRQIDLDLDDPVTRLTTLLGPLGPVIELRPNLVLDGGRTRVALRVTVIAAAGIRLLELDVARSSVTSTGAPCAPPVSPLVDAPVVDPGTRNISAGATAPTGRTIASCSFTVTPTGGTSRQVAGTYDATDRRCEATLPFATFPNGGYVASATATVDGTDPGTTTGPDAPFTLAGPTLGDPGLSGDTVSAPATPGSGADPLTGASCVVVLQRTGQPPVALGAARYENGACRATATDPLPAGEYSATVTVTDSNGQQVTKTSTVATPGPTVGVPALSGRELSATVAAAPGTAIASCSFTLTREGGAAQDIAGTVAAGRCSVTLPRAAFPAGEYAVVATAVDDARVSAQNTGVATLTGPAVGAPALDGRDLTIPVTPGSGATFAADACTVTINRPGGTTQTLTSRFEAGTCLATIPGDVQPGALIVETTAQDSTGDRGAGSGQVTLHGPSVGVPAITGRTVAADVVPEGGTTITACEFVLTRTGGTARTVAGVYAAGRCTASLPFADFAEGDYAIVARATDSAGESTTRPGTGTIADPAVLTVGAPAADGREVSAPVTVPAGATVDRCTIAVTPKAGGTTSTFTGTFADGRCTTVLPKADYPPGGTYAVVVEAVDGVGRTAQGAGDVTIAIPAVTVGTPAIDGRNVSTPVTVPAGTTATGCELIVTPKGGGAAVTVAGTLKDGTCTATLPRGDFPPGEYDVVTKVTDGEGRTTQGSGPVTIAGPTVGVPVAIGPVVGVPVTPGAGATVTECSLQITPAAGGAPQTVPGTYDAASGTCSAVLPAGMFPSGDYDVTATVKDSNGDTASKGGRVTVGQFGALPTTTTTTTTVITEGDVAQSLLACEGGRIALIEARLTGSRVRVSGVALPSMAGRTVLIRLSVNRKGIRTVARTTVGKDGQFAVTTNAPSRADRRTTARAKYVAQVNSTRSGSLRLTRRTAITSVTTSGGRIRISGRLTAPYPKAGTRVTIGQRASCTSYRTVGRTTTKRNGTFSASFAATKGAAGLYRVDSRVPSKAGAPARSRTYSLPRIVTAR